MADLKVIGKPEHHDKQAWPIVTGRLDYASDVLLGKKLFARVIGSPHAHAKITSIDTSRAEALPGVEAVCTYEDCPVFSDTILYAGQEVGAVAAVDENIAAQAVQLIDVVYDVLPHVVDPDEAMAPGAPLVGTWADSNISSEWAVDRGDVEAGMLQADVIVEDTLGWTNYFQHSPSQTCTATCYWTGPDLYVWINSQNPFGQRRGIAGSLGIPSHRVHLISHGTGVGHGDLHFNEWGVVAAVLSKKAGKPVQYAMSRAENYLNRTHQFPVKATIKMGCKNDGTITAIDSTYWADVASNGYGMVGGCNSMLRWAYKCANGKFRGFSVVTNKPRVGYWRCVYDPQSLYLMGIFTDMVAERLGMDPLAFRRKNLVTPDLPDQDSGRPYASNAVRECLEECATASGFSAKWHAPGTKTLTDGRMHGIGISAHVDTHGSLSSPVGAIVNLTRDGRALILDGISRAGGGTNTAHAHIVAETLGMNYDDVLTGDWGNIDVCSDGGGQGGSTRTITTGAAMQMAAEDAREQAFTTAADMLGVNVADVDASEGTIFEKGNPANSKTWAEVSAKTYGQVVGRGYTWAKTLRRAVAGFDVGDACEVRATAGAAVEVAVDTDTGEVEILNYYSADDMGRAIFYKGAENQIEGGIEIQCWQAFWAQQEVDALTGITLNADFLGQYPTTLDLHQDRAHAIMVEPDDACGPYGCKGMGEPVVASYGTVASAVYNAVGVWIKDPPITAAKILKALGKA